MISTRRQSPLTRASRALTALFTVWCLGCSAFDPIIGQLAGLDAGTAMVCGADKVGVGGAAATSGSESAPTLPIAAPLDDATETIACDCQFCCAPAPAAVAVAPQPPPSPRVDPPELTAPPSIGREPLVPPPQRVG